MNDNGAPARAGAIAAIEAITRGHTDCGCAHDRGEAEDLRSRLRLAEKEAVRLRRSIVSHEKLRAKLRESESGTAALRDELKRLKSRPESLESRTPALRMRELIEEGMRRDFAARVASASAEMAVKHREAARLLRAAGPGLPSNDVAIAAHEEFAKYLEGFASELHQSIADA